MMPSAVICLPAQTSHNVPGIALDQLELHNVKAEAANYSGKPAVRVDALPDAANGASYAILKGSRLHNGTIEVELDRKSTRLNSSHGYISYAVFCLKKKKNYIILVVRIDNMPVR